MFRLLLSTVFLFFSTLHYFFLKNIFRHIYATCRLILPISNCIFVGGCHAFMYCSASSNVPLSVSEKCHLTNNDLSLRLFDSIYSYFLAHIRSDQKVYISKSGKLIINPNPSDNLGVFQTINNRYLESSILQEITEQLKEFKSEYQKINGITKGTP